MTYTKEQIISILEHDRIRISDLIRREIGWANRPLPNGIYKMVELNLLLKMFNHVNSDDIFQDIAIPETAITQELIKVIIDFRENLCSGISKLSDEHFNLYYSITWRERPVINPMPFGMGAIGHLAMTQSEQIHDFIIRYFKK